MTASDVDDEVTTLLRRADQRYTKGRRQLVTAQSSVYRNLTILEEVGAVTRIVTGDDFARYELAEHLTEHHHHLICSGCGDVADFSLDDKAETALDRALEAAAGQFGFRAETHRLDLIGTCKTCS